MIWNAGRYGVIGVADAPAEMLGQGLTVCKEGASGWERFTSTLAAPTNLALAQPRTPSEL